MDVRIFGDAAEFFEVARSWLAADPFTTSILAGALAAALNGSHEPVDGAIWIAVIADGHTVGAAMHTPPRHLFLPRLPTGVATQIVRELLRLGHEFSGVTGESVTVTEFCNTWSGHTGGTSSVGMSMRMYRLEALAPPVGVPGHARRARTSELRLVEDWFTRFHAEAIPQSPSEDLSAVAARRLAAGQLWLWEDQHTPTAMAGGAAAGGLARIGPVYTPPEHRRHGYGAAVTARATQAWLDAGADNVVLYTDLANPTSNSIYQQMGYRYDHDGQERHLHHRPRATRSG